MTDKPRVLLLILASDDTPYYRAFQDVWRRSLARWPEIDYYFYKANPHQSEEIVVGDHMLSFRMPESLHTVYEKTLRAFAYIMPMLDRYDFVLRSNLSSFFLIDRYLSTAASWPRQGLYAGNIVRDSGFTFASGSGFTLSSDLVRRVAVERPPCVIIDDVSIGIAMSRWGIPIVSYPFVLGPIPYDVIPPTVFQIRVANKHYDRMIDVIEHQKMVEEDWR
jgi:hypothetical protein